MPAEEDTDGDIYILEYDVDGEQCFIPICRSFRICEIWWDTHGTNVWIVGYTCVSVRSNFNIPITTLKELDSFDSYSKLTLFDNGLLHVSNSESFSIVKKPINELIPIYAEPDTNYIVIKFDTVSKSISSIHNPHISIRCNNSLYGCTVSMWFTVYYYNDGTREAEVVQTDFDLTGITRSDDITYVELPIQQLRTDVIDNMEVFAFPIDLYIWVQRRTIEDNMDEEYIVEQIDIGFVGLRDTYNDIDCYSIEGGEIVFGPYSPYKP